jgi:adenylyltransferase/sulfurtransferase
MTPDQLQRYSRQIRVARIGEHGQQRLLAARVLIIGMGGLGSPAAMYLAAAGIGELVVSDFDRVEDSNLQRQIIHRADDIGELKAHSAQRTLAGINPQCRVTALDWQLDDAELAAQVGAADVVLDCCDNFATRFAVNRACVAAGTPLVSGAAIRMEGQIASFLPEAASPCYECIYPGGLEHEETCAMEGVLAPLVGVMGSLQALQAILILTGQTDAVRGKLLLFDAAAMSWRAVKVPPAPGCPTCGARQRAGS